MGDQARQALNNAAASSAMEGLELEQRHLDMIERIWTGQTSLREYLKSLKEQFQEA